MKKIFLSIAIVLSAIYSFGQAQSSVTTYEQVDLRSFLPSGTAIVDSSTDWRNAFQLAINYLRNTGGIINVPKGNLYCSGRIYDTINNPNKSTTITIVGQGGRGSAYVTGVNAAVGHYAGISNIFMTSSVDTLFVVTGTSTLNFTNVSLQYTGASTTPTSIGIYYGNASYMTMETCSIYGFGINIDIKEGFQWRIDRCDIEDAHTYGIRIQDSLFHDAGDNRITNSSFFNASVRGAGSTLIQLISSGGFTFYGNKFNGGSGGYPLNCIYAPFLGTVDMDITGNSFENFTGYAFFLSSPGTGIATVALNNNQMNRYGAGGYVGPIIAVDGLSTVIDNVIITGNSIAGQGGNDTAIYIKGANVTNIKIDNLYEGFQVGKTVVAPSIAYTNNIESRAPELIQSLTESSHKITFDPQLGARAAVTLTGNDTLVLGSNTYGQPFELLVGQNGTGGWHLIVSSGNTVQGGSGNITLPQTTPGTTSYVRGYTNGSNMIITDVTGAYATIGAIPYFKSGMQNDGNLTYDPTVQTMTINAGANTIGGLVINGTSYPALSLANAGTIKDYVAIATGSGGLLTGSLANDMVLKTSGSNILLGINSTIGLELSSAGRTLVNTAGTDNATGQLQVTSTTFPLALHYDVSNYTTFATSSAGAMTITPTGSNLVFNGAVRTQGSSSPTSTNTYDLGTTALGWGNLYLTKKAFLGTTTDNSTGVAQIMNAGSSQLGLHYDNTHYATFTVGSTGALTIAPSSSQLINSGSLSTGSVTITGAGQGLFITEGANGHAGQTTLVSGTKAITITGITTATRAFVQLVTPSGATLTVNYQAVCTANTLTIQANLASTSINTADGSTLNYVVIN